MGIKKAPAGVEDIVFGMGTEEQYRKDKTVVITQINGHYIPYSHTESLTEAIDRRSIESQNALTNVNNDLQLHKSDTNNPHGVTVFQIGAAPAVHRHSIADVDGLNIELSSKSNTSDVFLKSEYLDKPIGGQGAGKPIVLSSDGLLDAQFGGSGMYFVEMYTPSAASEYPNSDTYGTGAYWIIDGVDDTNGYTYTSGDLNGKTIYNGDALLKGEAHWGIFLISLTPNEYYKLNGSLGLKGNFAGGGYQIKNIADGTEYTDAVTLGQLQPLMDNRVNKVGDLMTGPLQFELVMSKNETIQSGHGAILPHGYTIPDGLTLTVEEGATVTIL
jgi:hypothetical protein